MVHIEEERGGKHALYLWNKYRVKYNQFPASKMKSHPPSPSRKFSFW